MARRPNGNIVYLAGFKGGTTAAGLVEIDPAGRELHRLADECAPFGPMHHEVQVLPDGRVLYLSRDVLWDGYGDPAVPQEGDTLGIWGRGGGHRDDRLEHLRPPLPSRAGGARLQPDAARASHVGRVRTRPARAGLEPRQLGRDGR